MLTAGRISDANRALIEAAYTENYSHASGGAKLALQIAQVLMISTPEFHAMNVVKKGANGSARTATPSAAKNENIPDYKAIIHVNLFGAVRGTLTCFFKLTAQSLLKQIRFACFR